MVKLLWLFIATVLVFFNLNAQTKMKAMNLTQISKRTLLNILHNYDDYMGQNEDWQYFDNDSTYKTRDSIVLVSNAAVLNSKDHFCYKSYWRFVNQRKNRINIGEGEYLCKEPPLGAKIIFGILSVEQDDGKFIIVITDHKQNLIDRFQVLKIEYVEPYSKLKYYRLALLRIRISNSQHG